MELQFSSFLLIAFSVGLIFVFTAIMGSSKTPKTPPGPPKLPIIGNLHNMVGTQAYRTLRNLSNKYGPLMHLQLGDISTIVISSSRLAKEVMQTHDVAFANRPKLLAPEVIVYGLNIAFSNYGPYWRQMRKIAILELLSAKNVQSFSSIREDETEKLVEFINSSKGSPVNLTEKLFELTNSIVSRAAFGKKSKDQEAFLHLISVAIPLASGLNVFDLFPSRKILHLLSGTKPKLYSLRRQIDTILGNIISDHQQNSATSERGNGESGNEDLVDVLLRHQKAGDLECPISMESIKAVIMDIFTGGTDTSSTTLEWAVTEIVRMPKVMEKLQRELRETLKGKKTIQQKDIEGLSYLSAVIKETLRLHAPAPLLVPRECREQRELDGYTIPVKTQVLVNAWAIARDPEFWPDGESFIPERFVENDMDFIGNEFHYLPFGAGRRICPGMHFGLASVQLPLAKLMYHFDWKVPDGMKPEELHIEEIEGASTKRKGDLCLIATPYDTSVTG